MADVYPKALYPAQYVLMGSTSTGMPASGIMSMHITYPDTEYSHSDIEDWQSGVNTNDWRQGITIMIRTPLASDSITEAKNVIAIDLKQQAADHGNPNFTYDLGTEEAARFIAAKINSRRIKMVGERDKTSYLKARYVRQSMREKYTIEEIKYISLMQVQAKIRTLSPTGYPTEMRGTMRLHTVEGIATKKLATGTYEITRDSMILKGHSGGYSYVYLNSADFASAFLGSPLVNDTLDQREIYIDSVEDAVHTVVLSWEKITPHSYWAEANMGPVVQGLGAPAVHNMIAKPMDGGNMGLPSTNHYSRSGRVATAFTDNQGYNRFSIEGLNSCNLPEIPPPDFHLTTPHVEGITKLHPDTVSEITSNNKLFIEKLEYGTEIPIVSTNDEVNLENGYNGSFNATTTASQNSNGYVHGNSALYGNDPHLKNYDMTTIHINHGIKDSNEEAYARPFRTTGNVNSDRVQGLQISNEERVFDDIDVVDDQGNTLTLNGKSPWGTIIRDFTYSNERTNPETGLIEVGPSAPGTNQTPNLRIQLPKQEDIPGSIFVRSGHDRVQAWSNQTWGLGGLAAPNPRTAGVAEASNQASQFDTHDRMLVFHCQRILHKDLEEYHGLDLHTPDGGAASGKTRLFAAHRISDHVERGSVLKQTNNGVETGNLIPHHRIRFGRYGHSFVSPTMHRGTPFMLRRQLHRSHGSAYSLMFEAETEYKHHGFGSGATTNSSTVFELDTLETKASSIYSTGAFASDGLPLSEIAGKTIPDIKSSYTSPTPRNYVDFLFAPGQEYTKAEGVSHEVQFAKAEINLAGAGSATKLSVQGGTLTANNRFDTASEVMVNGFILSQYKGMGGRLEPIRLIAQDGGNNWFVRGFAEGVIRPRVATELATVPPLFAHDPELLNMNAAQISTSATVPSTAFTQPSDADHGLIKNIDTFSGAKPDAFLCNWLAEYSHPAWFGTNREHFLMFRYRESGMPRSRDYPAVDGLFLRNASFNSTTAQAVKADPFERLYIAQWLQNYGYNGLNAAGHGNIEGLRGAGAVLMGHTTIRESQGTLRLPLESSTSRYSRGEGIGDGIDPTKQIGLVKGIDVDSSSIDFNQQFFAFQPFVAIDISRRLPVRSWGFRTASDSLNMLAGDPTEADAGNGQAIMNSGRFDGGDHDSVAELPVPKSSGDGTDWGSYSNTQGIEKTVPVGFVANDFTVEATPFERNTRQSNDALKPREEIGIGLKAGFTQNTMLSPHVMAAGGWSYELDDTRPTELPVSGAVLWLKGESLDLQDGDSVASWTDSTVNAWKFVQSAGSAQPLFIKRDPIVNNHPVVDCDGSDYLELPFDAKLNTAEMTVFVVGYVDSDDGNIHGLIESRSGSPATRSGFNLYARMDSGNEYQFWMGSDTGWTIVSSATNSAEGQVADILTGKIYGGDGVGATATIELYENGQGPYSATGAFYASTSGGYRVGNVPSTFYLNGKIAEVVQYDRKLTTAEQYEVEAYLSRKYAIPISTSASTSHTGRYWKLDTKPLNHGSDPFIDLHQWTGKTAYDQAQSPAGRIHSAYELIGLADFYHLKGNALHTNMRAISKNLLPETFGYPPNGQQNVQSTASSFTITEAKPLTTADIADVRQVQARTEPRMGLVMEVESERNENKKIEYGVVGTRAISLHTDLELGYQFPVLPSHQSKALLPLNGFSVDGAGSASTEPDWTVKPTWSPDSNANKGAISITNDTQKGHQKTHALDIWAVRGSAGLPAWGGVYILRKTYLNRGDEESFEADVESNTGKVVVSNPKRRYVDYIVRPMRPLKLYGFASDLLQDGFVMGPRSSVDNSTSFNRADQIFTRDKRYGIFEMNYDRDLGEVESITSAYGAFEIAYPDFNEYGVVWHLIPSANMLQFAKSDAHRFSDDGNFNPKIEARFSQSPHTGGGEPISQSETRYATEKGIMGDHARQHKDGIRVQSQQAMRIYPTVKVVSSKGSGVYSVDDASVLPSGGGKLFALKHTGSLTYSGISDDDITISTGTLTDSAGNTVSDYVGMTWYFTDVASAGGTIADARSTEVKYVVSPSFLDNAVVAMEVRNHTWTQYNQDLNVVDKTTLNFQGLLHYEPSDFLMASQRAFTIENGKSRGLIRNLDGTSEVLFDSKPISASYFPPYIIDANNIKWRVAEVIEEEDNRYMVFNDLSGKNLVDSGMAVGLVRGVQLGNVGMRSTDAAIHLLNDAAGSFAGIGLVKPNQEASLQNTIRKYTDAHSSLSERNNHSNVFVSRTTKGLNTMDVIRNLSQIDGRQIVNEKTGKLIYSDKVFDDSGIRLGVESGAKNVAVSRLFDSPNEVVIVGDVIAGNEIVFIRVQDSERVREAAADGEEGLVKTLRQEIPGLKTVKEARSIAKALLSRVENGAPMIRIEGMMNASAVSAGDLVSINLPTHGVVGKFAVFESVHTLSTGETNLVVAQYEKGLEGILADLRTATVSTSGLNESSGDANSVRNISLSSSVEIISVHKVSVRNVNNTGFIIGAKHQNGLGKIGVRDDAKRGVPIGTSKSRRFVVR